MEVIQDQERELDSQNGTKGTGKKGSVVESCTGTGICPHTIHPRQVCPHPQPPPSTLIPSPSVPAHHHPHPQPSPLKLGVFPVQMFTRL